MTKDEFLPLAKAIKTYYPSDKLLANAEAVALWYDALKDLSYREAAEALRRYVLIEKEFPTIAGIREQAATLRTKEEQNELEAWLLVSKAVRNSAYHAKAEYDKLPPLIKKTLGGPEQLRQWAISEKFEESVEKSHFMRSYRNETCKAREEARLTPELKKTISQTGTAAEIAERREA